jgi:proteic killer suppression protein
MTSELGLPWGLQIITRRVIGDHDSGLCRFRSGIDLVRTPDSKLPADIQTVALRKRRLLNQARVLGDLRVRADRQGQHSMRINDQWRVCFVWDEGGPSHVEIVDYHA